MQVINDLNFHIEKSAVCIGKFDGIHLGHRLLTDKVISATGLNSVMFTFSHDSSEAGTDNEEQYIYTEEEKKDIAERLHIDYYISLPFSMIKGISAQSFIRDILIDKLDAHMIVVGEDFHFGKGRVGDVSVLKESADLTNCEIYAFEKLKYNDSIISSTYIRELISKGDILSVNELLYEPYHFNGVVIEGEKLGRTIGFPTVNLEVNKDKLLPPFGAYSSNVTIYGDKVYKAVSNLGRKPTVGEYEVNLETFILDFDKDIYGEEIRIDFAGFLRPEKKFQSVEELKVQLNKDVNRRMNII